MSASLCCSTKRRPARVIGAMGILEPPLIFVPLGLLFLVTLPVSTLGIIFAIRLLRLDAELYGFKKPYAVLTIVASICFATFILAPVGLLLDAIGNVLLGLIYLKPEPELVQPEFV